MPNDTWARWAAVHDERVALQLVEAPRSRWEPAELLATMGEKDIWNVAGCPWLPPCPLDPAFAGWPGHRTEELERLLSTNSPDSARVGRRALVVVPLDLAIVPAVSLAEDNGPVLTAINVATSSAKGLLNLAHDSRSCRFVDHAHLLLSGSIDKGCYRRGLDLLTDQLCDWWRGFGRQQG